MLYPDWSKPKTLMYTSKSGDYCIVPNDGYINVTALALGAITRIYIDNQEVACTNTDRLGDNDQNFIPVKKGSIVKFTGSSNGEVTNYSHKGLVVYYPFIR